MKLSLLKAALGCIAFAAFSGAAHAASSVDDYRWNKRLLIVFASDASSAPLAHQRAIAKAEKARLAERDLMTVEVIGDTVQGASDSADALRHRYDAPAGAFRVLLIGKDGGIKMKSDKPISPERLFGTIDAMPMRQQEMQRAPRS